MKELEKLVIIEQIEFSLLSADVIFFLVDAKVQNEQNKEFAKWLKRKTNKPVILIANKCESHQLHRSGVHLSRT